ncbi:ras-domain-containing protein [Rhizoclosmatium globosum]|uniref:Ras-domain-containing protein n=1 Tax=Rhizoclosmatium globosum TaxID=329046 RepID=A0A1Y2CGG8_9FUNG|nr:ras-domain-containing protein [Rhizoclosmatium globosum]|eukprot:ORY46148.1 ras-domain-containing protein [Rhizoclosmatium globosum]
MNVASDIEATFKLLLIGDSGTGKSSLLLRFTDDAWLQPDEVAATIGVDFKVKTMEINEKKYKLTIWDTAGQERFRTLTSSYYRGAQGVIMVYDVTQRESFDHLTTWFNELDTYSSNPSWKEGEAFAKRMGTLFIEASAKTRAGVKEAFLEVVRKIIETPDLYQKPAGNRAPTNVVNLDAQNENAEGGGCC